MQLAGVADVPPVGDNAGDLSETENSGGGCPDISLMDIFAEAVEVDEKLKDLADYEDDVPVEELVTELRVLGEPEK